MSSNREEKPEYSKLAEIYDTLMEDVNYEYWADFIDELIQQHHPDPHTILELACGTGSLAFSLDELGCYRIVATDKSPEMIAQAERKQAERETSVEFHAMDFLDIQLDRTFDIALSVFDSINYLGGADDILVMLGQVEKVLERDSLFIFDFTTPLNSIQAIEYLNNEEGYTDRFRFFRKSRYDPVEKIHYNDFRIEELSDDRETVLRQYGEIHRQRIYTLEEMEEIVGKTDFRILASYEGFDMEKADNNSLRITMVLQCPNIR